MVNSILVWLVLVSTTFSGGIANFYIFAENAYAHNFAPNSLSTFLTVSLTADIELTLAESNFPSNVTLALDHAEKAVDLVNDAYYSDDDILYDNDFIDRYNEALTNQNVTVQALVVANLVDQVLKEYGEAIDSRYDLTNMSKMAMATSNNSELLSPLSPYSSEMNIAMQSSTSIEESQSRANIVNIDNYQSAQKLSERLYQFFKNQLLQSSNNASKDDLDILEKNLYYLKDLINERASAEIVMTLAHTKIHPNLQAAYGLELQN